MSVPIFRRCLWDLVLRCIIAYQWSSSINYTVSQKRIRDIIDRNLKKDCQILIIFGTNRTREATG